MQPLWIAAIALVVLPLAMRVIGLTTDTASTVVILAIAAMGLNLCVGYAGLVSFGHGAWFGIGAYAAAILQRTWFGGEIWLPILLSMLIVAVLSTVAGILILRRRGVYFSLLTLALAALTYTISFRWTDVTGGENGLGDLKRGNIGPISLDNALAYYILVAADRPRRSLCLAARAAFAVRSCGGGDPREPVARHVPGLSGRALQARRLRALGGRHRSGRRAARDS